MVLPDPRLRLQEYVKCQSEARLHRFAYELGRSRRATDPDAVHDVRVSIRRYESCLATFEAFFPARAAQKFHRRLKDVLKPAGAVRDRDIALELAKDAGLTAGSPLAQALSEQRKQLAKRFQDGVKHWSKQNSSDKWRRRLLARRPASNSKTKWDASGTSSTNAAAVLPKLAHQFFRAGRAVAQPSTPDKKLHRFRLKVKRFRYTLELFKPCFGPTLDEHIRKVKELQEHLGTMNDCASTLTMLKKASLKNLDGTEQLKSYLAKRIQKERAAFFDYWARTFRPEDAEQRWADYLRRFAGRVSKPNTGTKAAAEQVSA